MYAGMALLVLPASVPARNVATIAFTNSIVSLAVRLLLGSSFGTVLVAIAAGLVLSKTILLLVSSKKKD